jgi:hypothetical protein
MWTYTHPLSDLFVSQSLKEQLHNLPLTAGKAVFLHSAESVVLMLYGTL